MTTPAALAAQYTDLSEDAFSRVQLLLGVWGVLADLSFSDLLLLAPVRRSSGRQLAVLGQMRPTTAATVLGLDLVGQLVDEDAWPGALEALRTGLMGSLVSRLPSTAGVTSPGGVVMASSPLETGQISAIGEEARLECVPVRHEGIVVAVMVRVGALQTRRRTGRLERTYRDIYHRLAAMVAAGTFPFDGEEVAGEDTPRVGDGLLLVDTSARVQYCSPNAMNAMHRMGVNSAPEGRRLQELGVEDTAVQRALETCRPVIEEVERRPDVIVLVHSVPLIERDQVTGAVVLIRDVTDLRRLDRLLLSKDAAIREVHHRVKNNLQTISSLLSLQARRLEPGKGREALREAERRVRSIALVHEILSREPGDQVPFQDIVVSLIRMARDSVDPGSSITITAAGDPGEVAADTATPLAVVLAELLQNAIEHGFASPPGIPPGGGTVRLLLDNDGRRLRAEVLDNGRGLPPGFDIARTTSLGLSIVRDLVTSQLGGTIEMHDAGGTAVVIAVPVPLPGAPSDPEAA